MKADFTVQTPSRSYPVFVRDGLPDDGFRQQLRSLDAGLPFLIIDQQAEKYYGEDLRNLIYGRNDRSRTRIIPSGEASKSFDEWKKTTDFLLENGARRNTPVLAVGGGVTGDLAGFAAASTMRGLPLIHIPTTLLAMVDSSIGGKTGINHAVGKNLVGSFYQPLAIFIHTGFLSTLPDNEWTNGLSEILKYAAIRRPAIFRTCRELFLEERVPHSDPKLVELIRTCAKIKADVVAADERESKLRMILNFGHTFAHSLENLGGYQNITHGEAVFIGMLAATHLSNTHSASINPEELIHFRSLYSIDPEVAKWSVTDLIKGMYQDKKRSSDRLKVVLLQEWGTPYVTEVEDTAPVESAWEYALNHFQSPG